MFATVPERFKHIQFVTSDQETLLLKLPPKIMIEDSEAMLSEPGSTYPIPPFYKRLFNGIDPVIPEDETSSRCMPSASATTRSASAS